MTTDERRPNPGSAEAVAAGCICAVIDNHRGRGIPTKGLEAAHDAVRDALGYRHGNMVNLGGVHIDFRNVAQAAIEAYLRAASNDAEPVAWTSSGNLDGLRDHDSLVIGSMCNRQGDGWTVPLYLTAIEPVAASPGVPDGMARLQGSVPEGWKLVPVEPTEAMMNAAPASYSSSFMAIWPKICGDIYRALLAAAPASPEPSPSTEDVMREARGALAIALSAIEKAGDDLQASGAYPVGALAALIVPAEQVRTAITNIDRALSSKQRSGE